MMMIRKIFVLLYPCLIGFASWVNFQMDLILYSYMFGTYTNNLNNQILYANVFFISSLKYLNIFYFTSIYSYKNFCSPNLQIQLPNSKGIYFIFHIFIFPLRWCVFKTIIHILNKIFSRIKWNEKNTCRKIF